MCSYFPIISSNYIYLSPLSFRISLNRVHLVHSLNVWLHPGKLSSIQIPHDACIYSTPNSLIPLTAEPASTFNLATFTPLNLLPCHSKGKWANRPCTDTSKTMSQTKPIFSSCFSEAFCHSDRNLANTGSGILSGCSGGTSSFALCSLRLVRGHNSKSACEGPVRSAGLGCSRWLFIHRDYCLGRMASALPDVPWPLGRLIIKASAQRGPLVVGKCG